MNNQVTIISFSSRKSGNCEQISDFLSSLFVSIKEYRFSNFQLKPCGNCTYECFQKNQTCPHSGDREKELMDSICKSQTVYFVIPNYQDYPCANFFIFQERMQGYFHEYPMQREPFRNTAKRFIIVSNTSGNSFRRIAEQYGSSDPDLLVLRSREFGMSSIRDSMIQSAQVQAQIRAFAGAGQF